MHRLLPFPKKKLEKNVTLDPRHDTLALDMESSTLDKDKKIDSYKETLKHVHQLSTLSSLIRFLSSLSLILSVNKVRLIILGRLLSRWQHIKHISTISIMQWFRLTVANRRNVTKFQKALSFLAELREYHHTYIYKLVKSTTSLVMHIISVAKALKNISHIYISYTVPKK